MCKLSLNLAGGGSRGIAQAAYLQAFVDAKIVPSMVFGSSVGTLNGCLYLQGEMGRLKEMWLSIKTSDVYSINYWNLPGLLTNKNSVFDSSPLKRLIDKYVDHKKIVESGIPFYVGVTNLTNGTSEIYKASDISEEMFKKVVLASASVPLAFPPVELLPGVFYGDSGLTNNWNLAPAVKAGAESIILLSPTANDPNRTQNALDMFQILTSVPEYGYLDREIGYITKLNEYQDHIPEIRDIQLLVIQPPAPLGIDLLDFDYKGKSRKDIMINSYKYAKEKLDSFLV